MKKKKWWSISVLEYSSKVIILYLLAYVPLVIGIIYGLDDWTFDLDYTFQMGDLVLPVCFILFLVFFIPFKKKAKQEFREKISTEDNCSQ